MDNLLTIGTIFAAAVFGLQLFIWKLISSQQKTDRETSIKETSRLYNSFEQETREASAHREKMLAHYVAKSDCIDYRRREAC